MLPGALKGKGVVHASGLQRGRLVYGAVVTRYLSYEINIRRDFTGVSIVEESTFPEFVEPIDPFQSLLDAVHVLSIFAVTILPSFAAIAS